MQNPFEENTVPTRPTFLTILCVLTITWNIIGLYNGINRIVSAEKMAANRDKVENMFDDIMSKYSTDASADQTEQMQMALTKMLEVDNIINGGIANILSTTLILLGGFWMWQLKKKGFYAYIVGNLIGVLAPIVLMVNQIGWMLGILALINAALFTALYATNLKHLS